MYVAEKVELEAPSVGLIARTGSAAQVGWAPRVRHRMTTPSHARRAAARVGRIRRIDACASVVMDSPRRDRAEALSLNPATRVVIEHLYE